LGKGKELSDKAIDPRIADKQPRRERDEIQRIVGNNGRTKNGGRSQSKPTTACKIKCFEDYTNPLIGEVFCRNKSKQVKGQPWAEAQKREKSAYLGRGVNYASLKQTHQESQIRL